MQKGRIIWSVSLLTLFVCLLPLSVKIFGTGCFATKVNLFDEKQIDKAYQSFDAFENENDEAESSAVNRESGAVVIEATTKRVLYSNNKDVKLFPASTTKVLTALTVLNNVSDIDAEIEIPSVAVGVEGSSIYLKNGDKRTIRELLYGLMLRSGNDAAVALAVTTSGSVEDFVLKMNETAKLLGAENSNFKNPHGLHDDEHYTTAYDLALITAAAFKNDTIKQIVGTKSIKFDDRYYQNKNKMLWNYDGANGVKTGYTKASGRCLVSSALRDDMQLICVVLNHYGMWEDSKAYMEKAFKEYKMRPLFELENETVNVLKGKSDSVKVYADNLLYPMKDGETFDVRIKKNDLSAPFKENTKCGTVNVYDGNHLIFSSKLYTICGVERKSIFDRK